MKSQDAKKFENIFKKMKKLRSVAMRMFTNEVYLIGLDNDANMVFDYEKMVSSLWGHVEMDLFRRAGSSAVKDGWCYHKGALSDVGGDALNLHPVPKKFELRIYDPREKLAKIKTSNKTGWFILSRVT